MSTTLPVPFAAIPETTFNAAGSHLPWCNKCNRPVDFMEMVFPIFSPYLIKPTGEKIVTVGCHGEQFKVSNWYGVVPADYVPYGCF